MFAYSQFCGLAGKYRDKKHNFISQGVYLKKTWPQIPTLSPSSTFLKKHQKKGSTEGQMLKNLAADALRNLESVKKLK